MLLQYFYWTFIFYIVTCDENIKSKKIDESIRQYGNDGAGITYYPVKLNTDKDPPAVSYHGKNLNYLGYPHFETPKSHRVVKKSTVIEKAKKESKPKLIIRVKSPKQKKKIEDKITRINAADINFSKKIYAKFKGNLKDGLKSKVTANFNDRKIKTGTAKDMVHLLKKVSKLFKKFGSKSYPEKSTYSESTSSDKETVTTSTPKPNPPLTDKSTSSEIKTSCSKSISKSSVSKSSSSESESSGSFSVQNFKRVKNTKKLPIGILKENNVLHPFDSSNSSKDKKRKKLKPLYLKKVNFNEIILPRKKYSDSSDSSSFSLLSKSFDFSNSRNWNIESSSSRSSRESSESFSSFDLSNYKKLRSFSKRYYSPHESSKSNCQSKKINISKKETHKQPKLSLIKLHQRSIPKNQITIIPRNGSEVLEKNLEEKRKSNEERKKNEKYLEPKERVKRNEYRLRGHYESHVGQPFGHFTDLTLPHVANGNIFR